MIRIMLNLTNNDAKECYQTKFRFGLQNIPYSIRKCFFFTILSYLLYPTYMVPIVLIFVANAIVSTFNFPDRPDLNNQLITGFEAKIAGGENFLFYANISTEYLLRPGKYEFKVPRNTSILIITNHHFSYLLIGECSWG